MKLRSCRKKLIQILRKEDVETQKMIERTAKRIAVSCAKNNVIQKEQEGVCAYGMELLIATACSTAAILGAGLILHQFLYTIFLLVPFYHIRMYAGGIHAETYTKCILSFTVGFLMILLGTEYLIRAGFQDGLMLCSLMSFLVIWLVSPVEDHSRPLSVEEQAGYKKKARISALGYESMIQAIYYIWKPAEALYAASAVSAVALVLILGIVKNQRIGYRPAHICRK